MVLLLAQGLELRDVEEPAPKGGAPAKADRYRRLPSLQIMVWSKPMASWQSRDADTM
jgi:hypothetical protein